VEILFWAFLAECYNFIEIGNLRLSWGLQMTLKTVKTISKKDIVKTVADRNGMTTGDAAEIVQKFLDQIIKTLSEGHRIEFREFGIFEPKVRKARIGRNPKTGEVVNVPEKVVVSFKPGKVMKERVLDVHLRIRNG
jgi:integration host factor subunit beta